MSQQVVANIRNKYPTPLGILHADFLLDVARTLGLGLLRKDWGTFIRLPDGTGVAQDIVMAPDGRSWDILQDGEGSATPLFNPSDVQDLKRFYPVQPAGPQANPEVEGQVVQAQPDQGPGILTTLAQGKEELFNLLRSMDEANERRYLDLVNQIKNQPSRSIPTKAKGKLFGYLNVELPLE